MRASLMPSAASRKEKETVRTRKYVVVDEGGSMSDRMDLERALASAKSRNGRVLMALKPVREDGSLISDAEETATMKKLGWTA